MRSALRKSRARRRVSGRSSRPAHPLCCLPWQHRRLQIEHLEDRRLLSMSPLTGALTYYVNDGSTADDLWCTAVGNDANDGLTPATPKATVQSILSAYTLQPGNIVRIDTGSYTLTSDITVSGTDAGSSAAPLTFAASPYGVTFNRNNTSSGFYTWQINASYVTLTTATDASHPAWPQSWMKITGAPLGSSSTGITTR